MSNAANQPPKEIRDMLAQLPGSPHGTLDSFKAGEEGYSEKMVDAIEMIGEEKSAGFDAPPHSQVPAAMRYLHSSRTIHQLVTDRNRGVGIYLAVASLLLTASGAIFNANPRGDLIIPFGEIQRWCLPVTFATLAVLGVFIAFMMIRTRVGLIYEVAKMNALVGLPIGRVQRINPLSIHFILQAMISCACGASAALFAIYMVRLEFPDWVYLSAIFGILIGLVVTIALIALDMVTVSWTTSDERLQSKIEKE
jgi:hypothetical protein